MAQNVGQRGYNESTFKGSSVPIPVNSPISAQNGIGDNTTAHCVTAHFARRALEHVRYLSLEIGPRASTHAGEREAAQYSARVMREAGLQDVRLEEFWSGRSTYRPFLLAFCVALGGNLAFFLRPNRRFSGAAALLNAGAAWGFAREGELKSNWMRSVLPRGQSQNVIGIVAAQEDMRQRVVVYGHLDSHRTPIFYSSPRWLQVFSRLVSLGFISLVVGTAAHALATTQKEDSWKKPRFLKWLRTINLISAALQSVAIALTGQADTTPYTAGANDNASGAATVLGLAERVAQTPLQHTEVWFVNNGCEELGCYGIGALLDAHESTLREACFLNFDMVGIGTPALLTREGLIRASHPDAKLLEMARVVAAAHPGLISGAHPGGAYTDTGLVTSRGFRGLTIDSQIPPGHPAKSRMGYWHQTEDTFDKIELECLSKTHEFGWQLLQHIDAQR